MYGHTQSTSYRRGYVDGPNGGRLLMRVADFGGPFLLGAAAGIGGALAVVLAVLS